MELNLRPHQMKCVEALREGFRAGHRVQLLYAPTGFGKCLGRDTPVMMADGTIKAVQDVVTGDCVMSPTGEPRRVYGTTKGVSMLYRVTPTKGSHYVVNDEHILSLRMTQTGEIVNVSIKDYFSRSATFRHTAKGWRADALPFESRELLIDPYIFGVWLGDGTSKEPAITTADEEVVQAIEEYSGRTGGRVSVSPGRGCNTYRLCGGFVLDALRDLGVLGNKHIPHEYKTASIEQRLQLLAGIVDADGYLNISGYELTFVHERLAEDVAFLARSLGFAAYIKPCTKRIRSTGFEGTYYRITISGHADRIPCRVARRKAQPRKINKNVLNVGITVERIGEGEYFGFAIDGPDKLFLLGDFTVTHNTEVAIYLMKAAADKVSRTAIIMDRIVLVDQTSDRLTKYGISHGVLQASHWNYAPKRLIQVCSAQTLESRDEFPEFDLAIIDECHSSRKAVIDFIKSRPEMKVIGLTATPFTKGLGKTYERVVNGSTTEFLVDNKWLAPLKIYVCKEIDMTGAKKVAGEWSQDVATERGMKITGDIVAEWITKTHEIFGGPKKTIVFCSGVAHGADLAEQFKKQGYNFVPISYKDDDEFKREAIADFAKPDTRIHGLIATDILTRGFDVPDVMIGVSARPFSKSLSSHIQQLGRVMRSHPSKEFGLWLCHSGNILRFMDDWQDVYAHGVHSLKDDAEKARKEPTEREKASSKCPKCGLLWVRGSMKCAGCGFEKKLRNQVEAVAGRLEELAAWKKKNDVSQQRFYGELLWYAKQKNYNPNWAAHKFREKFGAWPRGLFDSPIPPTAQTMGWIRSRMIAYAKSRRVS